MYSCQYLLLTQLSLEKAREDVRNKIIVPLDHNRKSEIMYITEQRKMHITRNINGPKRSIVLEQVM